MSASISIAGYPTSTGKRTVRVMMVIPASIGGNFEYVAIPRQGSLFLAGALKQGTGEFFYDPEIWFEERSGKIDPDKDLRDVDILMVSALINEAPRGYEIAREARAHHPGLIILGGGPHMSPLAEEALGQGFDVIGNRECEDIIRPLCDALMTFRDEERTRQLYKLQGISFFDHGNLVENERMGVTRVIAPDFVQLPDFRALRDLSPGTPMIAGVIETIRGCTEKCTYCQVIKMFLGYRFVERETEWKRLEALQQLAADGLIHTNRSGQFSVFISDDLHPPPLRAKNMRDERLARLLTWKGRTENMHLICQARTEIAEDPVLANAMLEAGIEMLYLGVESDNAENLKLVKKRQDPGDVDRHLRILRKIGFKIVAMTIIGLPYDTEESIMNMADWVTGVSDWQTVNLLTPLPDTSNWDLTPLNASGEILQEGEMRPYHLYTGQQLVHYDERWSMEQSRDLFRRYSAKLHPIDLFYTRLFQASIRMHAEKWAKYIASQFSGFYPELEEKIEQALKKPSETDFPALLREIHAKTEHVIGGDAAEGRKLVGSFAQLFSYAHA